MSNVTQEIRFFVGDELYAFITVYAIIFSINFMYISAKGIKKLDAYFEDGKDYGDTWSMGANFRFFSYCTKFIKGKLDFHSNGMKVWMFFNALGYIIFYAYLGTAFVLECSSAISSWLG